MLYSNICLEISKKCLEKSNKIAYTVAIEVCLYFNLICEKDERDGL